MTDDELAAFYRRYNARCNAPVRRPRRVRRTQEFAFSRVQDGRIAEVWVTADDPHLLQRLR